MPKAARSPEDIESIKERILDVALSIINDQGFEHFSMRKLAAKLGITATTIYNYYSSKDELYLMILTRGFGLLSSTLHDIQQNVQDPFLRLEAMIRAYVDFGIRDSNYYNIMFTSGAPKYLDYVGTDLEPIAFFEKQTALQLLEITSREFSHTVHGNCHLAEEDIRYFVIRLWSSLHGIIALYNSRVLHEVHEHPETMVERMVSDLVSSFQEVVGNPVRSPLRQDD